MCKDGLTLGKMLRALPETGFGENWSPKPDLSGDSFVNKEVSAILLLSSLLIPCMVGL